MKVNGLPNFKKKKIHFLNSINTNHKTQVMIKKLSENKLMV